MRIPKYLSPTSAALFYTNLEEFYLKYLADERPPRIPQTVPMAVGSAFDAYVKSYLYERFYESVNPRFEFTTIFEAQVEPQNRDKAIVDGKVCFEAYKEYGALSDLMLELDAASTAPRMEFTVEGKVSHEVTIGTIPLSGKPDLYFITKTGAHVIYDWKVNGFYGSGTTSPAKGYTMIRGHPEFRGLNAPHKEAMMMQDRGLWINVAHTLDQTKEDWAQQLSIYSWLLGENVGGDFIVGIDQLVFSNPGSRCRIAKHRCKIAAKYQIEWFQKLAWAWKVIESGHIFRDLSPEDSLTRQKMLDNQFAAFADQTDPKEQWFTKATRQQGY